VCEKSKKSSATQVTFNSYQAFLCLSLLEFFLCLSGIFMLISALDASIHAYQIEKIEIDLSQNDPFF
jgi:hypothetical protein